MRTLIIRVKHSRKTTYGSAEMWHLIKNIFIYNKVFYAYGGFFFVYLAEVVHSKNGD